MRFQLSNSLHQLASGAPSRPIIQLFQAVDYQNQDQNNSHIDRLETKEACLSVTERGW